MKVISPYKEAAEAIIEAGGEALKPCYQYCIVNLDDSVLNIDKGDTIEIKDISELVQEAI